MSIKDVIKRYENEEREIHEKIEALNERAGVVELMLKELRSAARSGGRKSKPAKKRGKKKAPARKKGGLTVRDAILKTVAGAKKPLPAKEIIDGAVKLSGGAVSSIRTQINSLAKGGLLKQVPYEGRGFRYSAGGGKPAPKKAAKKPAKKAAKKAAKKPAPKPPAAEAPAETKED
jgi:hypothetical protein